MRTSNIKKTAAALLAALLIIAHTCPVLAEGVCTVATNRLNVRSESNTRSTIITVVKLGDQLSVIENLGDWIKISINGGIGYVSAQYVTTSGSSASSSGASSSSQSGAVTTSGQTGVVTATRLNVRVSPSTSSNSLGLVSQGTTLTITGTVNNWLQINYGGVTAYVSADYVRVNTSGSASASSASASSASGSGSSSASSASSSQATGTITSTLRVGSVGSEVKTLQQRLIALGYLSGSADGIFGQLTRAAMVAFQKASGLSADGIAGPMTIAALTSGSAASAGSSSSAASSSTASPASPQAPSQQSVTVTVSSSAASQAIALTNSQRVKYGLSELTVDSDLMAAAQIRAQELTQVFDHTRPDGSDWYTVSAKAAGENLALGQPTAEIVMAQWMNSEGHRANILDSSYRTIGIACVQSGGTYYWVQLFGR